MIPILYEKGCTDFSNNGIGFLVDCISCEVTEERNGSYEAVFTYPIEGRLYEYITEGTLIKAKPNETSDLQLFRIYGHSKPLNGVVTFNAEHISYELNGIPIAGLELKSATPAMALDKAISSGAFESNYKAWSDISTLNTISLEAPCSIRAALGGQEGSILDVWGGEYEFDNFTIKLHKARGKDNGVSIEYGKNLVDVQQERNITETYTHIMPYAVYTLEETDANGNITENKDVFVYLEERVLPLPSAENIGHKKAFIVDLSGEFDDGEEIDENSLRTKAEAYIQKHSSLGTPSVSITASFVQLWQTEEYKDIAPLERVQLCDTVTVRFARLGISASAKVVKTVYDVLKEKYISVELGEARSNFADSVIEQNKRIEGITGIVRKGLSAASEELKKAIKNATNLITGNSGGYVVSYPAEKPEEILILDTPDLETAVRVWRWNSSGLGYSKNGYNGDYGLAMTMDGAIVADFITVGTLNGALLKADSVQSNAISQAFKTEITDEIEGTHETIKQEFHAADEELKSSIETSYKNDITASEERTKTLIQQTKTDIELSVSKTYATKTELTETEQALNSAITLSAENITLTVSKTYATKAELTTTEQALRSAIDVSAENISLSVSKTYATKNELTATEENLNAAIALSAENITLSVSNTYATKTELTATEKALQSAITVSENGILSTVSNTYTTKTDFNSTVSTLQSSISQNATNISLKVSKGDVVSEINQSSDTISLKAGRLIITTGNFQLDANGNATMTNATMTGSVTSGGTSGYRTKITAGQIETYYDNKRVSVIVPTISGSIVRTGFLASTNYHGLMFGRVQNDTIDGYYYISLSGDGYDQFDCRHYFVGDVKFASSTGKFKDHINFANDCGLEWGGNIGLRYATSSGAGVSTTGLYLGLSVNSCPTFITAGSDINLTPGSGKAIKMNNRTYFYNGGTFETGTTYFQSKVQISDNIILQIGNETGIYMGSNRAFSWVNGYGVCVGIQSASLWLFGSNVYANGNSVATSSDERKKHDIEPLADKYLQMIKQIKPVRFKYNDDLALSGRTHTGFIAQDVLAAMADCGIDTTEFAAFVDVNADGKEYALRYDEIIAPMLLYIQHLEKRVSVLERTG